VTRISRAYFRSVTRTQSDMRHFAFMIIRDIPSGIMPFRSSRAGSAFAAKLARRNANLEKQIPNFLHIGRFANRDLADTLIQFVDGSAHQLAAFGEVYFEIVADNSSGNLAGKTLEILPQGRIIKIFNRYAQIVPIKDWEKNKPKVIFIPAERIWHLTLPATLGSPQAHRRLLKKLNRISEIMPSFTRGDGDMGQRRNYDFMAHNKNKEVGAEFITGVWGSIPSLGRIKGTTEYYYIVHSLQFKHCQALLREHIIGELNSVLNRLGVHNSIKVTGLAAAADIQAAISKMEKGEIGFKEALAATKNARS